MKKDKYKCVNPVCNNFVANKGEYCLDCLIGRTDEKLDDEES